MNSVHDMGGMHCYGAVVREVNEPVFHAEWERRVFGMFIGSFATGMFNIDQFRHAVERIDPAHYIESSYYEHWLEGLLTLAKEGGVLTEEELQGRMQELSMEEPQC
ncbi:MAG: hypothetical protein V7717_08730 [Porticoccaceae bacterium]